MCSGHDKMTDLPAPTPEPAPRSLGSAEPDQSRSADVVGATGGAHPGAITDELGEMHRLLVESVRDYAIFMLDPTGHVATWNEGAQRIKGYRADEIVGKHFSIFYPPEKAAEGFPEYELEVAAREGRFEDEGWRIRKDGSRFWANVVITALYNSEGTLVGFGKVTRDLTERRAAERQAMEDAKRVAAEEAARHEADLARRRTERLQAVTSALLAARTTQDVAKVVLAEGFTAVGADAGALALAEPGTEYVQVVADMGYGELPAHLRRFRQSDDSPMAEAIRTGASIACRTKEECTRRYPSLAFLFGTFEATVVVPLRSRGRTVGSVAVHRRSGRGVDEGAIAFMEAFAQQCGQALERAQLYQAEQLARARADEANRAKSEFLAAMSHELRTPLNAIGGYTDLLVMGLRGPITDEQRADLERIRRGQQHLLAVINDILNFSRIDSGQIEYDLSSVSLPEVLESVAHLIEPQAIAKGIEFVLGECPRQATVWADRVKAEQILLNLLSNAVKFTNHGGRVTLRCDLNGDDTAQLSVRDTGIGIAPDQLERIFEPFVQVGRSLTSTREGTGLGLAISRDLARAMGGDIRVESALGVGSTFTLRLPRVPAE
jgi:PAS domain S-box-containing protein